MTKKKDKESNPKRENTIIAKTKEKFSVDKLSQRMGMQVYECSAIFIKNGISLSKSLSIDEFKKLME